MWRPCRHTVCGGNSATSPGPLSAAIQMPTITFGYTALRAGRHLAAAGWPRGPSIRPIMGRYAAHYEPNTSSGGCVYGPLGHKLAARTLGPRRAPLGAEAAFGVSAPRSGGGVTAWPCCRQCGSTAVSPLATSWLPPPPPTAILAPWPCPAPIFGRRTAQVRQ